MSDPSTTTADADVTYHGMFVAMRCRSSTALKWITENVTVDPWQWADPSTLILEWNHADHIVEAMQEAGFNLDTEAGEV